MRTNDGSTPHEEFLTIFQAAVRFAEAMHVDAILLLVDDPLDWQQVKDNSRGQKVLVAADKEPRCSAPVSSGWRRCCCPRPSRRRYTRSCRRRF